MKRLAIIPARGGSKRIPRKNIRELDGKPIIAYSIEAAMKSELFCEVMISTDDDEIGRIAGRYGAVFPFKRSKKTADDYATTTDVLLEVLVEYQIRGREFEYFCCIYPTALFITASKLRTSFEHMLQTGADSIMPVVRFSYPIYRGLRINDHGRLEYLWPANRIKRSQDLETVYHDAGQFYWLRTQPFLEERDLILDNNLPFVVPESEVQDIDHETDWQLAQLKYKLVNTQVH